MGRGHAEPKRSEELLLKADRPNRRDSKREGSFRTGIQRLAGENVGAEAMALCTKTSLENGGLQIIHQSKFPQSLGSGLVDQNLRRREK